MLKASILFVLIVLPLTGCSSAQQPVPFPTEIYPSTSAPVQITISSPEQFLITNLSLAPIYYQVFPTELLPLIDWAPCESLDACKDIKILPEQSLMIQFESVIDVQSESVSIFWWHMAADQGNPNPDYSFPQLIDIPIP